MRFSSVDQVRFEAECCALSDWGMYLQFRAGFNPYSTVGARRLWERGYIGASPYSWEGTLEWDFQYQRGAAAQRIIQGLMT